MKIDGARAREMMGTPALSEAVARALGWKYGDAILCTFAPRVCRLWQRDGEGQRTPPPYATVAEDAPDYWSLCGEMVKALVKAQPDSLFAIVRWPISGGWSVGAELRPSLECFRDALILALAEAGLLEEVSDE